MNSSFSIVLIGAGNVAWHLGPAFERAGHRVISVYSRKPENAEALANKLTYATVIQHLDFKNYPADIFILAVKDTAVPEVIKQAIFPENSLVVHTSGSLPLSVIEARSDIRGGVFYPIQTFSKSALVLLRQTPIGIEASTLHDKSLLHILAKSISELVVELPTEARKIFHLAAVFACNFSNHLLGISQELLTRHHLDFNLLQPIVTETVQKAFTHPPFEVQTGPAVRFDEDTINHHRNLLHNNPEYLAVYNRLTLSIQEKAQELTGFSRK